MLPNTMYHVATKLVPQGLAQHYYWMGFFYVLVEKAQRREVHIFEEESGQFLGYATSPEIFYLKTG